MKIEDIDTVLIKQLTSEMKTYFDNVIKNTTSVINQDTIDQCFDEILHNFMVGEFSYNYRDFDLAREFYTDHGCDIRQDFERESLQYINSF
jgi:hypothetical protein